MNFHGKPIYNKKYIKAKMKTFNGVVNAIFCYDKTPKENVHYTCRAVISIDSVVKMDKNNYPQVYLEVFKYNIKKKNMTKFIDAELDSPRY